MAFIRNRKNRSTKIPNGVGLAISHTSRGSKVTTSYRSGDHRGERFQKEIQLREKQTVSYEMEMPYVGARVAVSVASQDGDVTREYRIIEVEEWDHRSGDSRNNSHHIDTFFVVNWAVPVSHENSVIRSMVTAIGGEWKLWGAPFSQEVELIPTIAPFRKQTVQWRVWKPSVDVNVGVTINDNTRTFTVSETPDTRSFSICQAVNDTYEARMVIARGRWKVWAARNSTTHQIMRPGIDQDVYMYM